MEIRLFRKEEMQLLQQSIHEIWGSEHVLSREANLLNHMFQQTPNHNQIASPEEYSFLGVWNGKKVIGLLGVMAFHYNQYGKKGTAYCLTNWIVEEKYRYTGAGLKLIQHVKDSQPNMILSLGVGEKAASIYKMMRWEMNMDVPRWIGIMNKPQVSKVFLNGESKAIRYYNELQVVKQSSSAKASHIQSLNVEKWDAFYWGTFAKETVGIARDAAFLSWRYLNHPTFTYRLIAIENEEAYEGLAVVRVEEVAGGYKIGRIVEMIYSSQDSAIALANAIVELDDEVLFYDFYSFSSVSTWGVEAVGFKRVYKTEKDSFVLPTRFQPIDLSNTTMVSAIYLADQNQNKFNIATDQQWYITKGDADQDRPN